MTRQLNRTSHWWVEVHRHKDQPLNLTRLIVSAGTRKGMGEPAGTFHVTLKGSSEPGQWQMDLLEAIPDDAWVMCGATDADGVDWVVMIGLVDAIRRQRIGSAGATTYTIQGRDHGKILTKTDLLDMPWLATDLGSVNGSAALLEDWLKRDNSRSPGSTVDALLQSFLGGVIRPKYRSWAVPESMVLPSNGASVPLERRQFSDVLSRKIQMDLPGRRYSDVIIPTGVSTGGGLWATMAQNANLAMNEMFCDLVPTSIYRPFNMVDGSFSALPGVTLRQRPFPAVADIPLVIDNKVVSENGGPPPSDDWRVLPATNLPESDFDVMEVGKSGAERFNWFSMEPGNGDEMATRGAQALLAGETPASKYWDSAPVVLLGSIERHGRTLLQPGSIYLAPDGKSNELWLGTAWARVLRDWYAPNAAFLSGTASVAYLCPGIHIGERLRVHMNDGGVEEYYIESVEHRYTRNSDGSSHGTTHLGITRGWRLSDPSQDYAAEVERWLRNNLEAST